MIVSSDASIKDGDPGAVVLKDSQGNILTDTSKLINNSQVSFGGSKTWIGDNNNADLTRPETIQVTLFRKLSTSVVEEAILTKTVSADTKAYENKEWSYLFNADRDGQPLLKYAPSGEEYIYYVKENVARDGYVPNYEQVDKETLSMDLQNQLKSTHAAIIKTDGDSKERIQGTTFILWDHTGMHQLGEYTSNQYGYIDFPNLSYGASYYISEKLTDVSKDYIVNSSRVQIDVGEDGTISLTPNRFVLSDADGDPATTGDRGYVFYNYKEPTPTKKVNGVEDYHLKLMNEEVTYSIDIPIKGVGDITKITVDDTVHQLMEISPEGILVTLSKTDDAGINETKDVTSMFRRSLSNENKTISFENLTRDVDNNLVIPQFENATLHFEFKAKVVASTARIKEVLAQEGRLNGDTGTIPNTASFTLNDKPENRTETNTVNITGDLVSVQFTKKLEGDAGATLNLPEGASATFDLYRVTTDEATQQEKQILIRSDITTDENGKLNVTDIESGEYLLRETDSPQGYRLAEDTYFTILVEDASAEAGKHLLKYRAFRAEGTGAGRTYPTSPTVAWTSEQTSNIMAIGDIIDPKPHLPEVNKMVYGKGAELKRPDITPVTTEAIHNANEHYDIPSMASEFVYDIEVIMPTDVTEINTLNLYDKLPKELKIVLDQQDVGAYLQIGTGQGADFIPEPDTEPSIYDKIDVLWTTNLKDSREEISVKTSDVDAIKATAGKVLRLTIPVKIAEEYKNKDTMTLDGNGHLVNTSTLTINGIHTIDSSATATPPATYGVQFKKTSTDGKALYDATFELSQYKDAEGNLGPTIPADIPPTYVSSSTNGGFVIPNQLLAGKYFLDETYVPGGYLDENGNKIPAQFIADEYYYVLEVGADSATKVDAQGKPVKVTKLYTSTVTVGTDGNPVFGAEELVGEFDGTIEDPVIIKNFQTVVIPIKKVWDDNNNMASTRPKEINFLLQRAIVNGTPDTLDPITGQLVAGEDGLPDTLDTVFNDYAKTATDLYNVTIPISSANEYEAQFASDPRINYGDKNHLNILRYTLDGKRFNYYVLESGSDGYKVAYTEAGIPPQNGDYYTDEVVVTNTLNNTILKLNKVDDSKTVDGQPNPQPVVGAKFNLSYELNGAQIVRTLTTGPDGNLDLSPYVYPNKVYTLTEIEAPAGYLKNDTVYTIVTDATATPTVYTGYVDVNNKGTVVADPIFAVKDVETDPAEPAVTHKEYTLTVEDNKTKTPPPEKQVNGGESYTLESLTNDFEYKVNIPVTSVEGYKTFVLEDTVNDLLQIVPDSATILADGKDIAGLGTLSVEAKTIKFVIDKSAATDAERKATFDQIANRTVSLTFRAKVVDGTTLDQLKAYIALPENTAGIANTAKLTINDNPANSNTVYVTTSEPGTPTLTKTVNGVADYNLKTMDEVFHYKVEMKMPDNVLGYASLSLYDTMAKVLEVSGSVKLTYVDANGVITPLAPGKDYQFTQETNNDSAEAEVGATLITASFVDGYDYTKLAGKMVVMEFDAKIKPDTTADAIKIYTNSKVPNTAIFVLNTKASDDATAVVTPPEKPTVDKKVNGADTTILTDLTQPVIYTVSATIPVNPTGYTKYVVSDQLKAIFDLAKVTTQVQVDGATVTDIASNVDSASGLVTATLDNGVTSGIVQKYAGKTIVLTITAPIDGSKDLSMYLAEGKLPNTAEVLVNDEPNVSDNADATVPQGQVTLTKTADGQPLPAGLAATFDLYRVVGVVDGNVGDTGQDTKLGSYQTNEGKIAVSGLEVGDYYFVETQAPVGYLANDTKREFTISADPVGVATANPGKNFATFTVDNTTKGVPEPKKDVSDSNQTNLDHVDLSTFNETFTYKVEVPVTKVDGWSEFTITDPVDAALTVDQTSIKVDLVNPDQSVKASYILGDKLSFDDPSNTIRFHLSTVEELQSLVGTTARLSFGATIKGTPEDFLKAHPNALVGNKAEINIGNQAIPTNEVTVTPPGDVPAPVKTVNGDDQGNVVENSKSLKLGSKDQHFFYDVRVPVPNNVTGYSSFIMTDLLETVLETPSDLSKVTVYVNDMVNADLKKYVTSRDNNGRQEIKLAIDNASLDPDFDFTSLAGKTIRLSIEANIKADASQDQLKAYIIAPSTEVLVPNTANLTINGISNNSNKVNITPPGDEPTVEKTVETTDVTANKEKALLSAKDQAFTYRVNVAVPSNVEGYKTILLEDNLEDVLAISSYEVQVAGIKDDGLTSQVVTDSNDSNKLSLAINDNFTAYAGKTISLVINAKIKDSVTMDEIAHNYGQSTIPNKANLTFNGTPKTSNEVGVTPPGETPTPVKDVNAQNAITLTNVKDEFTYNIRYTIPTNVTGFNKLLLTDPLEKVLQTSADRIKVYVDDVYDDDLTQKVVVAPAANTDINALSSQSVSLQLDKGLLSLTNRQIFESLAGKTIRVEIKANIVEGADLSSYATAAGQIPNEASLKLNDDPTGKTTPKVTVTPPKGSVILTKLADGQALTGEQRASFELYQVVGNIDSSENGETNDLKVKVSGSDLDPVYTGIANASNNQITVTSLDPGSYYFKEVAAPTGYVLNETPIPFTIEADQTLAKSLTWNNVKPGTPIPEKKVSDSNQQDLTHVDLSGVDETFSYKVIVPTTDTNGWSKFVLNDQVDKSLAVSNIKVTIGSAEYTPDAKLDADVFTLVDNKITFEINDPAKAQALKGQSVVLTFDAKISDIIAFLAVHPNAIVGNTADLDIGNGPVSSNEVTVTPPGDTPELDKKVNGKDGVTITNVSDALTYTMDITVSSNTKDITKIHLVDEFLPIFKLGTIASAKVVNLDGSDNPDLTTKLNAIANVLTLNGQKLELLIGDADADQFAGHKIIVSIDASIDTNQNLAAYLVAGSLPNTAKLSYQNDPSKDIADTAKVTPPGDDPTPHKDVNGKNSEILGSLTQNFTYHINANVPADLTGFAKYVLSDNLDKVLETSMDRLLVKVDGVDNSELTGLLSIGTNAKVIDSDENTVVLDIPISILEKYKGKHIELSIGANIISGSDLSGYTNNQVPNQGNLSITDDPNSDLKTENIPVTPPNDKEPPVEKTVSKADGSGTTSGNLDLAARTDKFIFNVNANVPTNVNGYTQIKLEDTLVDALKVEGAVVKVGGQIDTDLNPTINGQTVFIDITSNFANYAGKLISLEITSSILPDADLSGYSGQAVPNEGLLTFNGNPKTSNKVTVTPPGETPTPHKDVDGQASKELDSRGQSFTYNVWVDVPANVTGYTKINLTDDLEDVLKVTGTKVTVSGVEDTTLTGKVVLDDASSKVSLDITEGFANLAGKRINLAITAVVKDNADLSAYTSNTIPNKASLTLNDTQTKETDNVPVTPPPETPEVIKDVNGKTNENLSKLDQTFTYHVKAVVPQGANKFTLSDDLEDVLEVISCEVAVDNTVDSTLVPTVDDATSKVVLEITDGLAGLTGKEITLSITAKIKENADLSAYVKEVIPNSASLSINDGPANTSNNVTVTPSIRKFEVQKTWTDLPANTPIGTSPEAGKYEASFTLYANDAVIETFTLIGNDSKIIENLPIFDEDGVKINYRVEEAKLTGYHSVEVALPCGSGFINMPETEYGVVLQKIDSLSGEILPGAKFELWGKLTATDPTVDAAKAAELARLTAELEVAKAELVAANSVDNTARIQELEAYLIEAGATKTALEEQKAAVTSTTQPETVADIDAKLAQLATDMAVAQTELDALKAAATTPPDTSALEEKVAALEKQIADLSAGNAGTGDYSLIGEYTTDDNGLIVLGGLKAGSYYFKEIEAPAGYKAPNTSKHYDFVVPDTTKPSKPVVITVSNEKTETPPPVETPEYTKIQGKKSWVGDRESTRPTSIVVRLTNTTTGEVKELTVTKASNWTYDFGNVLTKDANGKTYTYKVEELVPRGYQVSYDGYNITNSKEKTGGSGDSPEYTTVKGTKTWVGDNVADRPDAIVVKLINNTTGEVISKTVTKDNNWTYDFGKVMIKDANGKTYNYKVEEVVPSGYKATYNGYNITNTKGEVPPPRPGDPEYVIIKGTKTWIGDKEADRPEAIVVKLVNITTGEVTSKTVTKDTNWAYDFGRVITKDTSGKTYLYRMEEVVPSGYKVSYEGYDIVNTKQIIPPTVIPTPSIPVKPGQTTPVTKVPPRTITTSVSPQTFVEGYGSLLVVILVLGTGLVVIDRRRRKK